MENFEATRWRSNQLNNTRLQSFEDVEGGRALFEELNNGGKVLGRKNSRMDFKVLKFK